jgi:hypothetical protein
LINGYLRFTENYSLSQIVYLERKVSERKDIQEMMKAKFEQQFQGRSKVEQDYILKCRQEAVGIMMSYMILSSGPLLLLSVAMMPFVAAAVICHAIQKGLVSGLVF